MIKSVSLTVLFILIFELSGYFEPWGFQVSWFLLLIEYLIAKFFFFYPFFRCFVKCPWSWNSVHMSLKFCNIYSLFFKLFYYSYLLKVLFFVGPHCGFCSFFWFLIYFPSIMLFKLLDFLEKFLGSGKKQWKFKLKYAHNWNVFIPLCKRYTWYPIIVFLRFLRL